MTTYRKNPIEVEAFQMTRDQWFRPFEWPYWLKAGVNIYAKDCEIYTRTLEGDMHVSEGDYIIQGIQGEIYPCKPDIFEATYTEVKGI